MANTADSSSTSAITADRWLFISACFSVIISSDPEMKQASRAQISGWGCTAEPVKPGFGGKEIETSFPASTSLAA
jgi:hypothetical protein